MNQLAPITADEAPAIIAFTIPGVPQGKGRPRFTTAKGLARAYTPAKTQRYEDLIRCEAYDAMGGRQPFDEPVSVTVYAYVPIPKSLSKRKREQALNGTLKPITRPDIDNYLKAALDGCNAIIFRDDSCVTDTICRKRYSERPRLVINIERGEDFA